MIVHVSLIRFLLIASAFALVLCCYSGIRGQVRESDPQKIIKKAVKIYASYSSYQDAGVVATIYKEPTGRRIENQPFKLYFSREPSRFRAEWLDYDLQEQKQNVLWCDGQATYFYSEPDRYVKKESLDLGIAATTGVSSGATATIPHLLMPETGTSSLLALRDLKLLGEETVEKELCYRIKASNSDGDITEVWISKLDFSVRKVTTYAFFKDFSTIAEEIHRDIKINQPIPSEHFEFRPPISLSEGVHTTTMPTLGKSSPFKFGFVLYGIVAVTCVLITSVIVLLLIKRLIITDGPRNSPREW